MQRTLARNGGIDGHHVATLERVIFGETFHHAGGWCKCRHCEPAPPLAGQRGHSCADHVHVPGSDECVICGRSVEAADF